tara:strand:+ start:1521 stop:1721 length:201 start_codon:yes stop_codon:yes gene_type:complete
LVDSTGRLDRTEVLELQLGADQAIAESAGFHGQRLDVTGQLLTLPRKDHLQNSLPGMFVRAAHHHD